MSSNQNSIELEKTGKDIYRNKPTFKRTKNSKTFGDAQFVTWSQEEYANLGLQRQYLKLKSYQRFTEAWSLLERADARGLFDNFLASNPSSSSSSTSSSSSSTTPIVLRIASVGGGPGFELYACQEYFKYKYKNHNVTLELTSMDYEKTWGEYARLMGFRFIHYDLKTGNLLQTLGYLPGQLHFVFFSAVMEMVRFKNFSNNLFLLYILNKNFNITIAYLHINIFCSLFLEFLSFLVCCERYCM